MSVLAQWNAASRGEAEGDAMACCGSRRWAAALCDGRPYADEEELLRSAREIWRLLDEADWLEAFACHPRIGELAAVSLGSGAAGRTAAQFAAWSGEEQGSAEKLDAAVKQALAEGNRAYEREHGFLYIVCASGKTPAEMLAILRGRLGRPRAEELREAALQQEMITDIRLRKWLRI